MTKSKQSALFSIAEQVLIYLCFITFSLGQLGRISFYRQEINFYAYEGILFVLTVVLVFRYGLFPFVQSVSKYRALGMMALFFTISYLLSIISYPAYQNAVAMLYSIRFFGYVFSAVYVIYAAKKDRKIKHTLINGLLLFAAITAITSVTQFLFYPDLRNLIYLGWDPHFHRLFGVFFDTSIAAAVFGLMSLVLLQMRTAMKKKHLVLYFFFLLYFLFVILTFSRSAYAALFITCFVYLLLQKKYLILLGGSVLIAIVMILVPKQFGIGVGLNRTFSIESRLTDYADGLTIWNKNPVFGIGYDRLRYARGKYAVSDKIVSEKGTESHAGASLSSSYLVILACTGIVGFMTFLYFMVTLGFVSAAFILPLTYIMILSFTDNIVLHPFILFLLGSALAVLPNCLFDRSP